MPSDQNAILRPASQSDVDTVYELIVALAEYEHLRHLVTGTRELLEMALFGPRANAEAVIAEVDSTPVGFALCGPAEHFLGARPALGAGAALLLLSAVVAVASRDIRMFKSQPVAPT